MLNLKRTFASALVVFLASFRVSGLVIRQSSNLTSGAYVIGSIAVPGFTIGAVPGPFVGVANTSGPTDILFDIVEYPEGYVIHLPEGNAAPSDNEVALMQASPGELWEIVPVPSSGIYMVQTADGQSAWILPHDAPEGTPVALTSASPPFSPNSFFTFTESG